MTLGDENGEEGGIDDNIANAIGLGDGSKVNNGD